ncbi:M10 family metallopeptidase C-terminal domain-containing protein [Candidatus Liberibacter sp.]|uniref:M10 family metallopeptidase C-terminal domain-containing protein n=1 Tax=Candidatus Liberibacter sp. TaxID=34022 RepID=UPI0015F501A5|nr:M10 family metallopeptidase C-terminal domain-containing protein [Candidatus Liberibacter sp.]MBA5723815.1 M10 family metallopeptidase C-terminal domain-containing protein [Candidatus Liberibacter sp.]
MWIDGDFLDVSGEKRRSATDQEKYKGSSQLDGTWGFGESNMQVQGASQTYVEKPFFSTDDIAKHLIRNKNWSYHLVTKNPWVLKDHQLTYSFIGFGSDEKNVVRSALEKWSQVTGITFYETSDHCDIKFENNLSARYYCSPSDGSQYHMCINLPKPNLPQQKIWEGTYHYYAALHEIGHALGLSHPGNYNGFATYGKDNDFENDSHSTSVMSYFGQDTNFSAIKDTVGYSITPMVADILAVQEIYGLPKEKLENNIYQISVESINPDGILVVQALYDSGGYDTLNTEYLGRVNNYITLNPEEWSDLGGYRKNFVIARNTIIEKAIGGDGNDIIIGNVADNTLKGGSGENIIDGREGLDTALYDSHSRQKKIYHFNEITIVYDISQQNRDRIVNVEKLEFSDDQINLSDLERKSILEYTASYKDLMCHLGVEVKNAELHLMQFGIHEKREVTFDVQQYLNNYPDLYQVFGNDREAATKHYITSGFSEGRIATALDSLNSLKYIASHEDLIRAYHTEKDLVKVGREHFFKYGVTEGRSITFDPHLYLGSHADLLQKFGNDQEAATKHYITSGYLAGLSPDSFDSLRYIASHEDLIKAYCTEGDLIGVGKQHFSTYGFKEGRSITFDSDMYLKNHADLLQKFGNDQEAATIYYITDGFNKRGSLTETDALKYIASYEDLIRAYHNAENLIEAGKEHFSKYGFIEGRSITFDPLQYLNDNPSLRSQLQGRYEDATWEYITRGFWVGRTSGKHSQYNISEDYLANTASKPLDKFKLYDMHSQPHQKGDFSNVFDSYITENSFEDIAKSSDEVYNVGDMSLDILH